MAAARGFQPAPQQRLAADEFTELAVAADEAGFDQVWVSHDLYWRSAPVLVVAAAAATRRVRLGIGIMNPFSSHPAELAMHAATLQELSGGRFLLGIGAGAEEFLSWAGLPRPRPLSAAREAVLSCRALLDRRSPKSSGWQPEAHLRFAGPPVPIYLGAMGLKMLALGGEVADGVLGLSFPPERATASAAIVRAAAIAAGRDPESIDIPACFWCSIDDDPERAAAPVAEKLAYYGSSISAAQPNGATHLSFGPPLGPDRSRQSSASAATYSTLSLRDTRQSKSRALPQLPPRVGSHLGTTRRECKPYIQAQLLHAMS